MMKKQILNAITQMRIEGKKPTEIANTVGISVNTVKSHIRRHPEIPNTLYCLNCGVPVPQNEGRKVKKFCCDRCRSNWWNHQYRKGDGAHDLCG